MRYLFAVTLLVSTSIFLQCGRGEASAELSQIDDTILTKERAEFGKRLFFDKRLSRNNTISCASCHSESNALADTLAISHGVEGRLGKRNAPSLINISKHSMFMLDGAVPTLEMQALVPIQDKNEMDMTLKELIDRLIKDDYYREQSIRLYDRELDAFVISRAIAAYERTLLSADSKFDLFWKDSLANPLSEDEYAGWRIFSKRLKCTRCHRAPDFTDYKISNIGSDVQFKDGGRFIITRDSSDLGSFKTPSLRNVTKTFPYMHDGSINDLESVLQFYEKGGVQELNKHMLIKPFSLNSKEKNNLLLFFKTLESGLSTPN